MTFHSQRGEFPATRMRRLRQHAWSRKLVAECELLPNDLIWPLFILPGKNRQEEVASLPGVRRQSVDLLLSDVERATLAQTRLIPCERVCARAGARACE